MPKTVTLCHLLRGMLGAIALLAAAPASGQEIFKCRDARGRAVYQDSPCDGSVRRSIAPPPAVEEAAPQERAELTGDEQRITSLLVTYERCTHAVPALAYRYAMDYQRWRIEKSSTLARLERNAHFREAMKSAAEEGDRVKGRLTREQVDATTRSCSVVEYSFAPPARILSEVKAELDRDAAEGCKADRDRTRLEHKIESLPAVERQNALKYRETVTQRCAKARGG